MLQPQHRAWLIAHPDISEEWLSGMLREGWAVYAWNGDVGDLTPLNMTLAMGNDHAGIQERYRQQARIGRSAYAEKEATGDSWTAIILRLGLAQRHKEARKLVGSVLQVAREYARRTERPWPIVNRAGMDERAHNDRDLRARVGAAAYQLRRDTRATWPVIFQQLAEQFAPIDIRHLRPPLLAAQHARLGSLPWPIT